MAKVQPILDELTNNAALKGQLLLTLLPLASLKLPAMTTTIEHEYATWRTGTMDFVIAPLPIDDNVHVVGKMIGLWGMPRPDEMTATAMSGALLGWAGSAAGLDEFLTGFAAFGQASAAPTPDETTPLIEYIYSLRAPSNPNPPDATLASRGAVIYQSAGCATCHDGPRGSGKRAFGFDEVGTDSALQRWADPTLSGTTCCGIPAPKNGLTHGVKSPRLVGMWALDRFLHNGSLDSLDQVLCTAGDAGARPASSPEPEGNGGHTYGCELPEDQKQALLAYLLSH